MNKTPFLFLIITLSSCSNCSDTKTGIGTSSKSQKESIHNKVFKFEMTCPKKVFALGDGSTFKINNVWIENDWQYEYIKNKLTVTKRHGQQLIIDGEFIGTSLQSDYVLWIENGSMGCALRSRLNFVYSNEKIFILNLKKGKQTIERITFYRK